MSLGRSYHAPDANGAGENISGTTGYSPTVVEEAVRATQDWYNELKTPGYDFNNPGSYENPCSGHLTQVRDQSRLTNRVQRYPTSYGLYGEQQII